MPNLENWDGGLKSLVHVHVQPTLLSQVYMYMVNQLSSLKCTCTWSTNSPLSSVHVHGQPTLLSQVYMYMVNQPSSLKCPCETNANPIEAINSHYINSSCSVWINSERFFTTTNMKSMIFT